MRISNYKWKIHSFYCSLNLVRFIGIGPSATKTKTAIQMFNVLFIALLLLWLLSIVCYANIDNIDSMIVSGRQRLQPERINDRVIVLTNRIRHHILWAHQQHTHCHHFTVLFVFFFCLRCIKLHLPLIINTPKNVTIIDATSTGFDLFENNRQQLSIYLQLYGWNNVIRMTTKTVSFTQIVCIYMEHVQCY